MTIKRLSHNFRKAIDTAKDFDVSHEYIRKFPKEQCGHVSDMLAQYFIDNGITPVIYVNGTYYGKEYYKQCHTWLVVDGLVIDLTADQFKNYDYPLKNNIEVYVGPMTPWYELFEVQSGGAWEHFGLNESWSNYRELKQCYEIILNYLK